LKAIFWVRRAKGDVGLVGMRQLILSMGLVLVEVRSLAQMGIKYYPK
jgi:hypothetical protein